MLCEPWTFGHYPLHIANNTDYTVTPENGKMVIAQGCTKISSVDPQIAAYHKAAGEAVVGGSENPASDQGVLRHDGLVAGILGLPPWPDFQPFIVLGLSLGGVYALSGVGMVVLYRATGCCTSPSVRWARWAP